MHKGNEHHVLYFTKKEKNGIVVVLIINILILLLPRIISNFYQDKIPDNKLLINASNELEKSTTTSDVHVNKYDQQIPLSAEGSAEKNAELFYFDPNHISKDDWIKLGVKEKTIQTIERYLTKGGHFKRPEDLKKIWGLSKILADKLIPFVKFNQNLARTETKKDARINKASVYIKPLISINSADSNDFVTLHGIGPVLAKRIILFRNKLGGFYSVDQISEVWGLSDTVFNEIRNRLTLGELKINFIDINTASFEQMKSHPYIGYKKASAIITYRNQHGCYKSLEDIQKIPIIDEESYNKIAHYLKVKQL